MLLMSYVALNGKLSAVPVWSDPSSVCGKALAYSVSGCGDTDVDSIWQVTSEALEAMAVPKQYREIWKSKSTVNERS